MCKNVLTENPIAGQAQGEEVEQNQCKKTKCPEVTDGRNSDTET